MIGTGQNWTFLHHLSATEFLNYEGTKFSKSRNIGVFGDSVQETDIPSEIWRYYLLSMRPETSDTDFRWDDFQSKNNNEILANLGNLINRILVFANKNFEGKIPKFIEDKFKNEEDIKFCNDLLSLFKQYIMQLSKTYIKDALKTAMEISSLGNGYLQLTTPWNLLKQGKETYDLERAETLFNVFCRLVRFIGLIMEPFMPSFSAKLYELMNIKYEGKEITLLKTLNDYINTQQQPELFIIKCELVSEGQLINTPHPLFKKISDDEIKKFKERFGTGK